MKYLKKFENHTEYEEAEQNLILPNVSLCVQENEVHYNPYVPPMNVITYQASEKLTETTSAPYPTDGFKTNAFRGSSGQQLTMKSHTFENGVGTIEFDGDIASIGQFAFGNCSSLTSVTIPNSVINIGHNTFRNCTSLTSIVSNAKTAPTITNSTFQNVKTDGTLTVPSGSSGYDVWMGTGNYYLGKYNWTKVEQ